MLNVNTKYNRMLNKTLLGDQNVTINFHELKTHCERVKVVRRKTQTTPRPDNAVVVTCQSQGSPALKHPLLYGLFDSKWDHYLLNEHHAVLKKT